MKLYYPQSHYNPKFRAYLFPLLKPFIKDKSFTDTERVAMYRVSEQDFEFASTLEKADMAILPMAWNYYIKTNTVQKARDFIAQCNQKQKKVLVYNAGDFGVQIPYYKNLIVFRLGGNRSRFSENEYTLPPFITDPLKTHFNSEAIIPRPYRTVPVLGFCGQANASLLNAVKEMGKIAARNLKTIVGTSKVTCQSLLSSSFLRATVLKRLQQSPRVATNFIFRKQYRAGVKHHKKNHPTTLEFYNNIQHSDYVVCARGAGNFSVRFYETLAMGRIPVLINTDCSLPLDNVIQWKKHVVWIAYKERHLVAQKVTEFHKALSEADFIALQQANRNLWKEHLTLGGFFKEFLRNLNQIC